MRVTHVDFNTEFYHASLGENIYDLAQAWEVNVDKQILKLIEVAQNSMYVYLRARGVTLT